jgi:hypothetical protein
MGKGIKRKTEDMVDKFMSRVSAIFKRGTKIVCKLSKEEIMTSIENEGFRIVKNEFGLFGIHVNDVDYQDKDWKANFVPGMTVYDEALGHNKYVGEIVDMKTLSKDQLIECLIKAINSYSSRTKFEEDGVVFYSIGQEFNN